MTSEVNTQHPRVFWMLTGGYQIGSSRIHGVRVHDYLRRHGWNSAILFQPIPEDWAGDIALKVEDVERTGLLRTNDIVIFQKCKGEQCLALMSWMRSIGVYTVYLDSDMPLKLDESSACDWTVCPSAYQTIAYRQAGMKQCRYIPDAVEAILASKLRAMTVRRIKAVWFGTWTKEKAKEVDYVRKLLKQVDTVDIELVVISNDPSADVQWNLETIFTHLHQCDFAVFPVDTTDPAALAKSSNRAVQCMALGLPVIASPIPSYTEVIHHGWNGFLCDKDNEWLAAFAQMRDSNIRQAMAQNAFEFSTQCYAIETIGQMWQMLLHDIAPNGATEWRNTMSMRDHVRVRTIRARGASRMIDQMYSISKGLRYILESLKHNPFEWQLVVALMKNMRRLQNYIRRIHDSVNG